AVEEPAQVAAAPGAGTPARHRQRRRNFPSPHATARLALHGPRSLAGGRRSASRPEHRRAPGIVAVGAFARTRVRRGPHGASPRVGPRAARRAAPRLATPRAGRRASSAGAEHRQPGGALVWAMLGGARSAAPAGALRARDAAPHAESRRLWRRPHPLAAP